MEPSDLVPRWVRLANLYDVPLQRRARLASTLRALDKAMGDTIADLVDKMQGED